MSSSLYLRSDVTEATFGHAWRADLGTARSTIHAIVRLGGADVALDSSQLARELSTAAAMAAAALDRLQAEPELAEISAQQFGSGVPVGQTAELLECDGGDQCHTLEEFEAAAAALGRVRTMQQLTTVLAKVAHYAPEVIIRAVGELA